VKIEYYISEVNSVQPLICFKRFMIVFLWIMKYILLSKMQLD